ncbi:hypothetical protein ISD48_25840 [Pseudomonas aeruginosa]|nr:hypothetical protein [Pseudomonas aeruginosa]
MQSSNIPREGFYWRQNRSTGRWEVVEFDGESFCQSHAGGGGNIFSPDEVGQVLGPLHPPAGLADGCARQGMLKISIAIDYGDGTGRVIEETWIPDIPASEALSSAAASIVERGIQRFIDSGLA